MIVKIATCLLKFCRFRFFSCVFRSFFFFFASNWIWMFFCPCLSDWLAVFFSGNLIPYDYYFSISRNFWFLCFFILIFDKNFKTFFIIFMGVKILCKIQFNSVVLLFCSFAFLIIFLSSFSLLFSFFLFFFLIYFSQILLKK